MKNAMEILKAYEILLNSCSGKEEMSTLRSDVKKILRLLQHESLMYNRSTEDRMISESDAKKNLKLLQDKVLEDIKQKESKES